MKLSILIAFMFLFFGMLKGQGTDEYRVRQLTFQACIESNPQWANNGKKISYDSDQQGNNQVYILSLDKLTTQCLPNDSMMTQFAVWIPHDTNFVATASTKSGYSLVKYSSQTSEFTKLLKRNIQSKDAHFHPAGNLITFIGKTENDEFWRLFTYDFKYDNLNSFSKPTANCSTPRWSAKGEYISYSTAETDASTKHYIQLIHWYGKEYQQITDAALDLREACWPPVGSKIAYIGNNADSSFLIVSQKDGTHREIIYRSKQLIKTPCWSPDGKSIIFVKKVNANQQNIFQLILSDD